MMYACCDDNRRAAVLGSALNGMDFLEVLDLEAPPPADNRQRFLQVHFLKSQDLDVLTTDHFRIDGGERITNIHVIALTIGIDGQENVVQLEVDQAGDFSTYHLQLVRDPGSDESPEGFDPILATLDFSFKVECPSDFDCPPPRICPPSVTEPPVIDYLAKDYASFRRLMLDRLATLLPEWRDRRAADLGMVLVELLAYVGDRLSYEQDAVATEAYIGTARRRISVRRHARLVDYFIHDGSNARTWVQIQVAGDLEQTISAGTALSTPLSGQSVLLASDDQTNQLLAKSGIVFETMSDVAGLFEQHNEMRLYAWSSERCCLPIGAISATLEGHVHRLEVGDVLVFEEVMGPKSGNVADADSTHRHPVRLTHVQAFQPSPVPDEDPTEPLVDPVTGTAITEIQWHTDDALPFPLCLSSHADEEHGGAFLPNVTVARGNMVLADHGRTIPNENLGIVPPSRLSYASSPSEDRCRPDPSDAIPPRFVPVLQETSLTQAAKRGLGASARSAMQWEQRDLLPSIHLDSSATGEESWSSRRDLLNSREEDLHFVVEVESDGTAFIRFGDDHHGKRPDSGIEFEATYRVGNGIAGNIGVDSLFHIVSDVSAIQSVRNLTPGQGGREPESLEDVRQRAPYAFRTQERAVTPQDYEEVTGRHLSVQRAAATFRWTGSWHTVFLTVDRKGGFPVDAAFEADIRGFVERYRMAGYDLEVDAPRFVSLEMKMVVCVNPQYFRSHVRAALLRVFSRHRLPDGAVGLFHPDNFSFGQTIYLSPFYAAAQAIPGVDSVLIKTFQRLGYPERSSLQAGKIEMDRLEIARLDNNPNFPERGTFFLDLEGGK